MALSRDIVIRLLGDSQSAVKAQREAARAAEVTVAQYKMAEREYTRQAKAAETAARQQRDAMADVGRGAAVMGAAVVAGLGLSVRAAIDWESAFAGVMKTVDDSPEGFAALEKELRNLATTLPVTHEEIAGVAEAAGQLGIARGDIVEFTRVAVAMGVSTNLSAEEAATGMAQMMNIMGTASSDVDRMASTLVALGNAGASTEGEILNMAQRMAGAGNIIGATESDVLGLANTLASLGINAELGGGAMTRVMLEINTAMAEGGKTAEGFAKVAGMSAQEFARMWEADPMRAISAFTDGLARVNDSGGNVTTTLGELGISGTQNLQVMLGLAGAQGQLAKNLDLSSQAWQQNTALMNEANQRYETAASRIQIARNQINDAAIDVGGTFMPIVAGAAEIVADLARGFEMLPGPLKGVVGVIGGVAGAVGILGGAALVAAPKIIAFREAMAKLETSSSAAARGVGRFGTIMTGPWGMAIAAGVTLLGTLVTALGASSRASEEAAGYQRDLASAMRESGGAIDDNIRSLAARQLEEQKSGKSSLLEWAQRIGVELPTATDAILGQKSAVAEVTSAFEAYAQAALDAAVANGTADTFDPSGIYAARDAYIELSGGMGGAVAENQRVAEASKTTAEATAAQTGATQGLLSGLDNIAATAPGAAGGIAAVGGAAEATKAQLDPATQAIADWREELVSVAEDFVDPLNAYKDLLNQKTDAERKAAEATASSTKTASDSWENYVGDVDVSLTDLADRLQEQIDTQENWRKNIASIAQRGGAEVAQHIAAMGQDGVELAAKMADGSDKEFKRMAKLLLADVQMGGDQWTASMDTDMRVMAAIGKEGAKATAKSVAEQLGIGATEVARIAAQYGVALASGVNPILTSLGKGAIHVQRSGGWNVSMGRAMAASGGYISGPGGPTDDLIPAQLSNGEYVIQAKAVRKIGRSRLDMLNSGRLPESPGFATGGFVDATRVPRPPSMAPYQGALGLPGQAVTEELYKTVVDYVKKYAIGGPGVQNALRWAKSQVGKPYIWGGVGPAGYDCSGFMSAITNVIQGRSPYSRLGSTASFPWSGFAPGIAGGFSVGSTRDAGGGIGHMAGTLGGVNVESYGGHGPAVGGGARGANSGLFSTRAHLVKAYQSGTPYVPRDGLAYLHRGERIVTAEQNRTWQTQPAMSVPSGSANTRPAVNVAAPIVKVFLDGQEWRGMARVEAEDAVIDALTSAVDRGRYNP